MKIQLSLLCIIALLTGCHHEQELPNPCAGATKPVLSFKVLDQVNGISFDSDTIFTGTVMFQAPKNMLSYKWHIGTDPTEFTKQQFSLEFAQPEQVDIDLIVKYQPDKGCFPSDTGIDTLHRQLTVLPGANSMIPHTAIEGKYQGATTDAPQDTFTIQVRRMPDRHDPTQEVMALINVNKGCISPGPPVKVTYGYQGFSFFQDSPGYPYNGCKLVQGIGYLDIVNKNKITLEYTEQNDGSSPRSNKLFVGYRLK